MSADGIVPAFVDIPLDDIAPDLKQPRRRLEPPVLEELAASIAAHGVLVPIIVRPRNADTGPLYELVAGERRWRAARIAGLTSIRAEVRELDERATLEVQIAENAQRADMHPLDEADAYRRLHVEHRVEVEEIAARAGRPVGFIRQRLSLATLVAQGREALLADKLSLGIAQKIARLPAGDQVTAVEHLTKPQAFGMGSSWTVGTAGEWIRGRFYLPIGRAPFDATDTRLVPGAPACSACPDNSASQRDLFEDLSHEAHCTKPSCHAEKVAATWARETRDRAEAGAIVATIEESNVALKGGLASNGYVRADEKPAEHGGRRSWAELLKKAAPPVVLVRHPVTGDAVEMIRPKDLKAAIAAVGLEKPKKEKAAKPAPDEDGLSFEERSARDKAVENSLLEAIAVAVTNGPTYSERVMWQRLARAVAAGVGDYPLKKVVARRALTQATSPAEIDVAITEEIEVLPVPALRALIYELCLAAELDGVRINDSASTIGMLAGVDLKETVRVALAELDAAKNPKKGAKGKASKKSEKPAEKPAEEAPAPPPAPAVDPLLADPGKLVEAVLSDWPLTRGLDVIGDGRIVLWTHRLDADGFVATVPAGLVEHLKKKAADCWAEVRATTNTSSVITVGDEVRAPVVPCKVLGVVLSDDTADGVVVRTPRGLRVAWLDTAARDVEGNTSLVPSEHYEVEEGADGTWIATRITEEQAKKAAPKKSSKKGGEK